MDEHAKDFDEFYWWNELSQNVSAIGIMKKNIEHIDWREFCFLEEAIPIIEEHLDKVNWTTLSSNRDAMHILKNNQDKIDCLDYQTMTAFTKRYNIVFFIFYKI
jgi:hypothetical protein